MARKNVTDILYRFVGDSKNLQKATDKGTSALGGLKNAAIGIGAVFGAREVLQFAGDAIQAASAAAEMESKFDAVFKTGQGLSTWLKEWSELAGIADHEALGLAATFGNLAQSQGISEAASESLAQQVALLAGDMASFNDVDPATVFNDLNKALLTTEREGMAKYGIKITETEVKTRAAAIAAKDGRVEITKADKAYASYAIAVEQAGEAVGDLERTQDSAANKQRRQQKKIQDLQVQIGEGLLPAYEALLEVSLALLPVIEDLVGPLASLAKVVDGDAQSTAGLVFQLTKLVPWMQRSALEAERQAAANRRGRDAATATREAIADQQDALEALFAAQKKEGVDALAQPYINMQLAMRESIVASQDLRSELSIRYGDAAIEAFKEYAALRDILGDLGNPEAISDALAYWKRINGNVLG